MADDNNSDHDTFVSVDAYAPTQSSLGAQNADADDNVNDTVSLSEYIGEDAEDLLGDDILDHVANNSHDNLHDHSPNDHPVDLNNLSANFPGQSPQLDRNMRQNPNHQDSAFMWALTNETSPEAFRQNDAGRPSNVPAADDTISLGDEDDVCGSFDSVSLSGQHDAQDGSHRSHPLDGDDTEESLRQSVDGHSNQHAFQYENRHFENDDEEAELTAPSPNASHRPIGEASASQVTPAARRHATPDKVPVSSERPPLPPGRFPSSSMDQMNLSRRSSYSRSTTNAQSTQRPSPRQDSTPVTCNATASPAESQHTSHSAEDEYSGNFNQASHGFSSSVINNPFSTEEASGSDDIPEDLVIISKTGLVNDEEKEALLELANSPDAPKARLVKQLIETISFQRRQLEQVKASEVNLAGSVLDKELRRYSDVARERSYALDTLMEEVDVQADRINELEDENAELRRKLDNSEDKIRQVEVYYSNFVGDFTLTDNNVIEALENIHDDIDRFRRESVEHSEKKSSEVEDYARRLLEMEDIVADSRKRMRKMEIENDELRNALGGDIATKNDEAEEDTVGIDSPMKGSGRFISPGKSRMEEHADFTRLIEEQNIEIDNLRLLNKRVEEDKEESQNAYLSLNVELEEIRSKAITLQKQRDTAENKNRDLTTSAAAEKRNFLKVSSEMTKNIVQVVNELDQKESEVRTLRNELEDRESAYRSLQMTNQDLEEQLHAYTEAALDRSGLGGETTVGEGSQPLVSAFIESLQKDLAKAQTLLQERTADLEKAKKDVVMQDESIINLQKECSRLQAAAAVRRRSGSVGSPRSTASNTAEEEKFLRRLSQKLGCTSSDSNDLIEKLAKRVETLVVDREEFQQANEKLRLELTERERGVHKLRSEMQAEISALRAEAVHHENLKVRAQEELKSAEDRLLHVLNEGDLSRRESMGDITASSIGTRGWAIVDDDTTHGTGLGSRRASMMSNMDDTIRWNDPVIDAAVQSVNQLIGTKDSLAVRNRELREKLQALITALAANDQDGAARSLIIQSKDLQDELTGVVGMQQDIIDTLTQSRARGDSIQPAQATAGEADENNTLPFIHKDATHGELTIASPNTAMRRAPLGEATRFLTEQLQNARDMYSEKVRANADLCGVVKEIREELSQYKSKNKNIEAAYGQVQETHQGFLGRLAMMTGTEKSVVALEDFIRAAIRDLSTCQQELERKEIEERHALRRIYGLLAQKRVLSHMIGIYQHKYRLNILAPSAENKSSLKRRLRVKVLVVLAAHKLRQLALTSNSMGDATIEHDLPEEIDISNVEHNEVCLMDASVALSAVPRLENAIVDKDHEIATLKSSLASLSNSASDAGKVSSSFGAADVPRSSFVYQEDVLNRKNDLSRRLEKMIREKEMLEERLSSEKKNRLTAEAKAVKYMEKVSTYKKRLGKISAEAQANEKTYKAAVRYLKTKAEKAVKNDFNMDDENIAPWQTARPSVSRDGTPREPNADSRAMLQDQLARAEGELVEHEVGSQQHKEIKGFIAGLKAAIQRLEKPIVFARRSNVEDRNIANRSYSDNGNVANMI